MRGKNYWVSLIKIKLIAQIFWSWNHTWWNGKREWKQEQKWTTKSTTCPGPTGNSWIWVNPSKLYLLRSLHSMTRFFLQSTNSIGSPETDRTKLIWSLVFKNVGKWVDSWIKALTWVKLIHTLLFLELCLNFDKINHWTKSFHHLPSQKYHTFQCDAYLSIVMFK